MPASFWISGAVVVLLFVVWCLLYGLTRLRRQSEERLVESRETEAARRMADAEASDASTRLLPVFSGGGGVSVQVGDDWVSEGDEPGDEGRVAEDIDGPGADDDGVPPAVLSPRQEAYTVAVWQVVLVRWALEPLLSDGERAAFNDETYRVQKTIPVEVDDVLNGRCATRAAAKLLRQSIGEGDDIEALQDALAAQEVAMLTNWSLDE